MGAVFLDLDGTLTDPAEGITKSVIHALTRLGMDAPAPETLTWVIGPALVDSFAKLGTPDPEAALALYRERFSTVGLFENRPYPGLIRVLERLADDHDLYLATAKPHVFARRITAHFGIDTFLTDQFGPELDGTRNNKAALLAYALERIGINANEAVMVGDRHHDIDAARAVGMASIAVTWGYGTHDEHAAADLICEALEDLPGAVTQALIRPNGLV